ncbi:MAG: hypothetical protein ABI035_14620, partial [Gemmatimonadaceae bacterium]
MMNEDPLMSDEQTAESVAKYFEDNPELLNGIVPQRDLWPAIENRISARVLPLATPASPRSRRMVGRWIPTLIAASALIAGTAGVTYIVTSRASAPGTPAVIATGNHNSANPVSGVASAGQNPAATTVAGTQVASGESVPASNNARITNNPTQTPQPKRSGVQLASRTTEPPIDQVRKTYDTEIASLHAALESRRGQLNPATVQIIEQNLDVIDEAIRQSKAALARDPNSSLLNEQLDRTLAKKTGLLRAA